MVGPPLEPRLDPVGGPCREPEGDRAGRFCGFDLGRWWRMDSLSQKVLTVVYEDNHVIAVYKPHGWLTQGDRTGDLSLIELVKEYLKARYHKPGDAYVGLIHRLDRVAAGVVLFAKTSKAASRLSDQLRNRQIEKTYEAWVDGETPGKGALAEKMRWDEGLNKAVVVNDKLSKEALLTYRKLSFREGRSQIGVELLTGRKHQIRCQLAHLGHPILGDRRYGSKVPFRQGAIALWCMSMAFTHPTRKEPMAVTLPEALREKF